MRHVGALRELAVAAAAADGACAEGPAEGALQRQLVALLARLLRAATHSRPLQAFAAEIRAQVCAPAPTPVADSSSFGVLAVYGFS